MSNATLIILDDSLASLNSQPKFKGAVVAPCSRLHPDHPDYRENDVRGMHVTFPNGMTLSVQWNYGNYSNVGRYGYEGPNPTFETAAWYPANLHLPWFNPYENRPVNDSDCDSVQAYQSVAEVMKTALTVARHVPPTLSDFGAAIAKVAQQ